MKCLFCGHEFSEEQAVKSCKSCPLSPKCHLLRCPNCGYETARESRLGAKLKSLKEKKGGA